MVHATVDSVIAEQSFLFILLILGLKWEIAWYLGWYSAMIFYTIFVPQNFRVAGPDINVALDIE